jgi:hypothetical protein
MPWIASGRESVVAAAYALGALLLAGQAAVHIQQYVDLYHNVRWIGPLFIADAVASALVVRGLAFRKWQPVAALAGVVIAAGTLGGLAVSYARGLFGWQEVGFATPIELAVIFELGAVIVLGAALAADAEWSRRG